MALEINGGVPNALTAPPSPVREAAQNGPRLVWVLVCRSPMKSVLDKPSVMSARRRPM